MPCDRIIFRVHALKRMAERDVSEEDIRRALTAGEVIEEWPDDRPYPRQLIMGLSDNPPVYILLAHENERSTPVVTTVFGPDTWKQIADFRKREKK